MVQSIQQQQAGQQQTIHEELKSLNTVINFFKTASKRFEFLSTKSVKVREIQNKKNARIIFTQRRNNCKEIGL